MWFDACFCSSYVDLKFKCSNSQHTLCLPVHLISFNKNKRSPPMERQPNSLYAIEIGEKVWKEGINLFRVYRRHHTRETQKYAVDICQHYQRVVSCCAHRLSAFFAFLLNLLHLTQVNFKKIWGWNMGVSAIISQKQEGLRVEWCETCHQGSAPKYSSTLDQILREWWWTTHMPLTHLCRGIQCHNLWVSW